TQVEKLFGLFDPIGQALDDVDFTDLVFSELREIPPANEDIVLVNIGELSRAQIAAQIRIISQYNPKVIGIDSFFQGLKPDTLGDIMLAGALKEAGNLVMVSQATIFDGERGEWENLTLSHPMFQWGETGIANLYTEAEDQHQYKVCRTFPPFLRVQGEEQMAFALKVAGRYAPDKLERFMEFSSKPEEVINFTGNVNDFGQSRFGTRFYSLDVAD